MRLGEKMFSRNQQMAMDLGTAGQLDAAGGQSAFATRVDRYLDSMSHALQCFSVAITAIDADLKMCPPDDIDVQRFQFDDFAILDRHKECTLGTCFTDMAPLKVARENDVRMLAEDSILVDVTERPVIVAFGNEIMTRTVLGA